MIKILVARQGLVYLIDPTQDTARQVGRASEAFLLKQRHSPRAPCARLAVDNDLGGGVQLPQPPWQLAKRYEPRPGQAADSRFRRLPNVENDRHTAGVDVRLQFAN